MPNLQRTNHRGEEFRINGRGFVGPEFEQLPPEGVVRIIAVGDSCTFLLGLWRFAYPSILERRLNAAGGGKRFEVINAGIEGYNSTFAKARIEQELIGYRPHLVLIYVGWNDLMKMDPRGLQAVGKYATLAGLMEQSYLVRAYRKVMFVHLRPLLFQPKVGLDSYSRDYDEYVPTVYQGNLQSSVETLRSRGIQKHVGNTSDGGTSQHEPRPAREAARLLSVLCGHLQCRAVLVASPSVQPRGAQRGCPLGCCRGGPRYCL